MFGNENDVQPKGEKLKIKHKVAGAIVAFGLVVGGSLAAAAPAQALGTVTKKCTNNETATGYSSAVNGGFTTNGGVCGTAKSRLFYQTYNGSPTYYTSWTYNSSTAFTRHPGNSVRGGNHGVDNPGLAFTGARDFNS